MSTINITRPLTCSQAEAREALECAAQQISNKYDIRYRWEDDEIHFSRSGVKGVMRVASDQVQISAKLGFLLAMLKGPIEDEIHRQLDEHLN